MLEYDGPANDSKLICVPPRWRAQPPPVDPISVDKATAKWVDLPPVTVMGLTLRARCRVRPDQYADLSPVYGSWADSKRNAAFISSARAQGHLVIKRAAPGRNEYDTWISSDVVRQPRVAVGKHASCFGRFHNRTAARGPAYEEAVAQQRDRYRQRLDDSIGASIVTIELYLNDIKVVNCATDVELGDWKTRDATLGAVVADDLMYQAIEEAEAAITDLLKTMAGVFARHTPNPEVSNGDAS